MRRENKDGGKCLFDRSSNIHELVDLGVSTEHQLVLVEILESLII